MGVGFGPPGCGDAPVPGRVMKTGAALGRADAVGSGGGEGMGVPVDDGVGGMRIPGFGATWGTGMSVGLAEGAGVNAPDASGAGEADAPGCAELVAAPAAEALAAAAGVASAGETWATHGAECSSAAMRGSVLAPRSLAKTGLKAGACRATSASVARTPRTPPNALLSVRRAGTSPLRRSP